eukprot:g2192.t1
MVSLILNIMSNQLGVLFFAPDVAVFSLSFIELIWRCCNRNTIYASFAQPMRCDGHTLLLASLLLSSTSRATVLASPNLLVALCIILFSSLQDSNVKIVKVPKCIVSLLLVYNTLLLSSQYLWQLQWNLSEKTLKNYTFRLLGLYRFPSWAGRASFMDDDVATIFADSISEFEKSEELAAYFSTVSLLYVVFVLSREWNSIFISRNEKEKEETPSTLQQEEESETKHFFADVSANANETTFNLPRRRRVESQKSNEVSWHAAYKHIQKRKEHRQSIATLHNTIKYERKSYSLVHRLPAFCFVVLGWFVCHKPALLQLPLLLWCCMVVVLTAKQIYWISRGLLITLLFYTFLLCLVSYIACLPVPRSSSNTDFFIAVVGLPPRTADVIGLRRLLSTLNRYSPLLSYLALIGQTFVFWFMVTMSRFHSNSNVKENSKVHSSSISSDSSKFDVLNYQTLLRSGRRRNLSLSQRNLRSESVSSANAKNWRVRSVNVRGRERTFSTNVVSNQSETKFDIFGYQVKKRNACIAWFADGKFAPWSSAAVLTFIYAVGLAQVDVLNFVSMLFSVYYFILPRYRRVRWRFLTFYSCLVTVAMYTSCGIFGYLITEHNGSDDRETWTGMIGLHPMKTSFVLTDTPFVLQLLTLILVSAQQYAYGNGRDSSFENESSSRNNFNQSEKGAAEMMSWLWRHHDATLWSCYIVILLVAIAPPVNLLTVWHLTALFVLLLTRMISGEFSPSQRRIFRAYLFGEMILLLVQYASQWGPAWTAVQKFWASIGGATNANSDGILTLSCVGFEHFPRPDLLFFYVFGNTAILCVGILQLRVFAEAEKMHKKSSESALLNFRNPISSTLDSLSEEDEGEKNENFENVQSSKGLKTDSAVSPVAFSSVIVEGVDHSARILSSLYLYIIESLLYHSPKVTLFVTACVGLTNRSFVGFIYILLVTFTLCSHGLGISKSMSRCWAPIYIFSFLVMMIKYEAQLPLFSPKGKRWFSLSATTGSWLGFQRLPGVDNEAAGHYYYGPNLSTLTFVDHPYEWTEFSVAIFGHLLPEIVIIIVCVAQKLFATKYFSQIEEAKRLSSSSSSFRKEEDLSQLYPKLAQLGSVIIAQKRRILFLASVTSMICAACVEMTAISILYLVLSLPCLLGPETLHKGKQFWLFFVILISLCVIGQYAMLLGLPPFFFGNKDSDNIFSNLHDLLSNSQYYSPFRWLRQHPAYQVWFGLNFASEGKVDNVGCSILFPDFLVLFFAVLWQNDENEMLLKEDFQTTNIDFENVHASSNEDSSRHVPLLEADYTNMNMTSSSWMQATMHCGRNNRMKNSKTLNLSDMESDSKLSNDAKPFNDITSYLPSPPTHADVNIIENDWILSLQHGFMIQVPTFAVILVFGTSLLSGSFDLCSLGYLFFSLYWIYYGHNLYDYNNLRKGKSAIRGMKIFILFNWLVLLMHVVYQAPFFSDPGYCVSGSTFKSSPNASPSPCLNWSMMFGLKKYKGTCQCSATCVAATNNITNVDIDKLDLNNHCVDAMGVDGGVLAWLLVAAVLLLQMQVISSPTFEEVCRLHIQEKGNASKVARKKRLALQERLATITSFRLAFKASMQSRLNECVARIDQWDAEMWSITTGKQLATPPPPPLDISAVPDGEDPFAILVRWRGRDQTNLQRNSQIPQNVKSYSVYLQRYPPLTMLKEFEPVATVHVGSNTHSTFSVRINGLMPTCQYEIRVAASNLVGEGPLSTDSIRVTTSNLQPESADSISGWLHLTPPLSTVARITSLLPWSKPDDTIEPGTKAYLRQMIFGVLQPAARRLHFFWEPAEEDRKILVDTKVEELLKEESNWLKTNEALKNLDGKTNEEETKQSNEIRDYDVSITVDDVTELDDSMNSQNSLRPISSEILLRDHEMHLHDLDDGHAFDLYERGDFEKIFEVMGIELFADKRRWFTTEIDFVSNHQQETEERLTILSERVETRRLEGKVDPEQDQFSLEEELNLLEEAIADDKIELNRCARVRERLTKSQVEFIRQEANQLIRFDTNVFCAQGNYEMAEEASSILLERTTSLRRIDDTCIEIITADNDGRFMWSSHMKDLCENENDHKKNEMKSIDETTFVLRLNEKNNCDFWLDALLALVPRKVRRMYAEELLKSSQNSQSIETKENQVREKKTRKTRRAIIEDRETKEAPILTPIIYENDQDLSNEKENVETTKLPWYIVIVEPLIDQLLYPSLCTEENIPTLFYPFVLLYRIAVSNSVVLLYFIMFLNEFWNASILSAFYPISAVCYSLIEFPRVHPNFWRVVMAYTCVLILTKFTWQLPIFCQDMPAAQNLSGSSSLERNNNNVLSNGEMAESSSELMQWDYSIQLPRNDTCLLCTAIDHNGDCIGGDFSTAVNDMAPVQSIALFGIYKAAESMKLASGFGTYIFPELLLLLSLLWHRNALIKKGQWYSSPFTLHSSDENVGNEKNEDLDVENEKGKKMKSTLNQRETNTDGDAPVLISEKTLVPINTGKGRARFTSLDGIGASFKGTTTLSPRSSQQVPNMKWRASRLVLWLERILIRVEVEAREIRNEEKTLSCFHLFLFNLKYHVLRFLVRVLWEPTRDHGVLLKPGIDYYSYVFGVQIATFLYVLFFFSGISEQGVDNTALFGGSGNAQISSGTIHAVTWVIVVMALDRLAYLKRWMLLRASVQVVVAIGIHYSVFVLAPSSTEIPFTENTPLIGLYVLLVIYLIAGALQMRQGFHKYQLMPDMSRGDYGMKAKYLYMVYRAIPFVVEMNVVLDWACADTSMDLFMWFKLDSLIASLYLTKCEMVRRIHDGGYQSGSPRKFAEKLYMGFSIFLFIVVVITAPLYIFSSANPYMQQNPVVNAAATLSVSLRGEYLNSTSDASFPLYVASRAASIKAATKTEFSELRQSLSSSGLQFLTTESEADMQLVTMPVYSSNLWFPSPPAKNNLRNLLAGNHSLWFQLEIEFTRKVSSTNAQYTYWSNEPIALSDRHLLANMIAGTNIPDNQMVNVTSLYPRVLQLSNGASSGEASISTIDSIHSQWNAGRLMIKSDGNDDKQGYWQLACDEQNGMGREFCQTSNHNQTSADVGIIFATIASKVPSGLTATLTSSFKATSVITFYATVVLLISGYIRSAFTMDPSRIIHEEMPRTDQLLAICEGIAICRQESYPGKLKDEMTLYNNLISLNRRPEMLLRVSGNSL